MAEDKERLSPSAAKAKRNLLFFAALAWALALSWIRPSHEGRVVIAGIGAETTFGVILCTLAVLLLFNLISLWIHGPFGDKRTQKRRWHLLHPVRGSNASIYDVFDHISVAAGISSLPGGVRTKEEFEDWLAKKVGVVAHTWSQQTHKSAIEFFWQTLSWRARMWLRWSALSDRTARLLLLEDLWDLWAPLAVGVSGLGAVALRAWML